MTEEIKVEQPNGAAPETASTAAEAPATEAEATQSTDTATRLRRRIRPHPAVAEELL